MARAWCVLLVVAVGCASSPAPAPAVPSAPPAATAAPPVRRCSAAQSEARALARDAEAREKLDASGAIDALKRAVALEPDNDAIQARLSALYARTGDLDGAIAAAREAARLDPGRASYWRLLSVRLESRAASSHSAGDWAAVRDAAARCTALAADDARCLALDGRASAALGDDARALAALSRGIMLDPARIEPYLDLADHYLVLGDYPRALAVLALAEARAQGDDDHLYVVGLLRFQAYVALKRSDDVVRAVELSYRHGHGRHPEMAFNLGATYAMQDPPRADEAKKLLVEFIKRVCRGAAASQFRDQCETASALLERLGMP